MSELISSNMQLPQKENNKLQEEIDALRAEREAVLRHLETTLVVAKIDATKQAVKLHDEIDTLKARVAELEQENKALSHALDIYIGNDDKCHALLRSVGMDDTINVVPRLAELVKEYRKLKDATET